MPPPPCKSGIKFKWEMLLLIKDTKRIGGHSHDGLYFKTVQSPTHRHTNNTKFGQCFIFSSSLIFLCLEFFMLKVRKQKEGA